MIGCAGFLRPFIWSRVSGLMRFRDGSNSECASNFVQISVKSAGETLTMIRQALGEESMSCTRVFEWHAPFRADRKR
jgi:hypothetical protein